MEEMLFSTCLQYAAKHYLGAWKMIFEILMVQINLEYIEKQV